MTAARTVLTRSRSRVVAALGGALIAIPLLLIVLFTGDGDDCGPIGLGEGIGSGGHPGLAGYDAGQLALARLAVATGERLQAPPNAILAALMAGNTESGFRNYSNSTVPESGAYPHDGVGHDYDSVGPWQLRYSVWGARYSMAQLMDPRVQARWFYSQAARVPGEALTDPADLAQQVERSAPNAYADSRAVADALYRRFHGAGVSTALAGEDAACSPGPVFAPGSGFAHRVITATMPFVGRTPYVWGGGGPHGPTGGGFDCSGLVQYAIYQASAGAILLPRTTGQQQHDPHGQVIGWDQRATGDIVYFTEPGQPSSHHTGVLLRTPGGDELINAPQTGRSVSIDRLAAWRGEKLDIRRFGGEIPSSTGTSGSPTQPEPAASVLP